MEINTTNEDKHKQLLLTLLLPAPISHLPQISCNYSGGGSSGIAVPSQLSLLCSCQSLLEFNEPLPVVTLCSTGICQR